MQGFGAVGVAFGKAAERRRHLGGDLELTRYGSTEPRKGMAYA